MKANLEERAANGIREYLSYIAILHGHCKCGYQIIQSTSYFTSLFFISRHIQARTSHAASEESRRTSSDG